MDLFDRLFNLYIFLRTHIYIIYIYDHIRMYFCSHLSFVCAHVMYSQLAVWILIVLPSTAMVSNWQLVPLISSTVLPCLEQPLQRHAKSTIQTIVLMWVQT